MTLGRWLRVADVPAVGGRTPIPAEWLRIPRRLWPYQPKPRILLLSRPAHGAELRLLARPERGALGRHRWPESAVIALAVHAVLAWFVFSQPFAFHVTEEDMQLALRLHEPTELVAPSAEAIRRLTGQPPAREGSPAPAVHDVTLEDLLAEAHAPAAPAPAAPAGERTVPAPPKPAPAPAPAPRIVAPSEPQTAEAKPPPETEPPERDAPAPAKPSSAPPAEDHPLLAFEQVGPMTFSTPAPTPARPTGVAANPPPVIPPPPLPGSTVQRAIDAISRSGGGGSGLVVGDVETSSGVMEARELPPSRGNKGSAVQLLSDSQGVDFRPYLVRVLAAVRRNWQAVMPASAKLGLRGKVIIQFSVDRAGGVPKLVIAIPSGSEPLDRAAVASISASNPFPPLPDEYEGEEIRLQLNFLYNMQR